MDTRTQVVLGGACRYRVVQNWAKLPEARGVQGRGRGRGGQQDRVYVFNRGEHPMIVFDREAISSSPGRGRVPRARGIHIDGDDLSTSPTTAATSCASARPTEKCCSSSACRAGRRPCMSGTPFHRYAYRALAAWRYLRKRWLRQRARAQCSPDGKLIKSWGEPGTGRRVQHRAQHRDRPRRLGVRRRPREPSRAGVRQRRQIRDAVDEPASALRALLPRPETAIRRGRARAVDADQPQREHRAAPFVRRRERQAHCASRRRGRPGPRAGKFIAPHGLAIDSRGDIYVGEKWAPSFRASSPRRRWPGACVPCRSSARVVSKRGSMASPMYVIGLAWSGRSPRRRRLPTTRASRRL